MPNRWLYACAPALLTLAVLTALPVLPHAVAAPLTIALPDANFELPPGATAPAVTALPPGWTSYQWGPTDSAFATTWEAGAGRDGSRAVRAENKVGIARAGLYTHMKLEAGTYLFTVWARSDAGDAGRIEMYLGDSYSRAYRVGNDWRQISFRHAVLKPLDAAEINLQNSSRQAGNVWFDDLQLTRLGDVTDEIKVLPDRRASRPRTLLFSPINVNYLRDTAPQWAARGFRGFLFDAIMDHCQNDIWATDGDPTTRGTNDRLLQETLACNQACAAVGIDSNFIKIAINELLPDPFDDAAWASITKNFAEAARFARLSQCAGLALDTEYKQEQFQPDWEGYRQHPHPLPELKAKIHQRWRDIALAMQEQFPQLVLLTLPEGLHYYGPLYDELFFGLMDGLAAHDAPGGLQVLTEGSYYVDSPAGLTDVVQSLHDEYDEAIPESLRAYWKKRCSLAVGLWPLGYYRPILDKNGKMLGYSGRKETFGDKIVGSYADKSARYSAATFAPLLAVANTLSPRYDWIYGHGDVFWQYSPAQEEKYDKMTHRAKSNATLPTDPNLPDFFAVLAHPGVVHLPADGADSKPRTR